MITMRPSPTQVVDHIVACDGGELSMASVTCCGVGTKLTSGIRGVCCAGSAGSNAAPIAATRRRARERAVGACGYGIAGIFGITEEQRRVDPRAVPSHPEMKMRSGDPPRRAHRADGLAPAHLLPGAHLRVGKVEVHADEPVAVIDEDRVTGEEQIVRDDDDPIRNGRERRAGRTA